MVSYNIYIKEYKHIYIQYNLLMYNLYITYLISREITRIFHTYNNKFSTNFYVFGFSSCKCVVQVYSLYRVRIYMQYYIYICMLGNI